MAPPVPAPAPAPTPASFGPDADVERDAPSGRDVYAAASQRRDGAREAAQRDGGLRDPGPPRDARPPDARPASPYALPPRLGGPKPPADTGSSSSTPAVRPVAAPPVPPAPPPEPVAPAPPPVIPTEPAEAWVYALNGINAYQRTTVLENTAFGGFADGTLVLSIRNERYRAILREQLQEVDFVSVLPGFRRFEIRLDDVGRTGREARHDDDARRAVAAREAVERSPLVARLVTLLGGRVEVVEASTLEGGDRSTTSEDNGDD